MDCRLIGDTLLSGARMFRNLPAQRSARQFEQSVGNDGVGLRLSAMLRWSHVSDLAGK